MSCLCFSFVIEDCNFRSDLVSSTIAMTGLHCMNLSCRCARTRVFSYSKSSITISLCSNAKTPCVFGMNFLVQVHFNVPDLEITNHPYNERCLYSQYHCVWSGEGACTVTFLCYNDTVGSTQAKLRDYESLLCQRVFILPKRMLQRGLPIQR